MVLKVEKIGQVLLGIIILVILIIAGYILFMTVTDYKPEDKIHLSIEGQTEDRLNLKDSFSIVTFNIGYGGMDDKQDFLWMEVKVPDHLAKKNHGKYEGNYEFFEER